MAYFNGKQTMLVGLKGDSALIANTAYYQEATPQFNTDYAMSNSQFNRVPKVGESFMCVWTHQELDKSWLVTATIQSVGASTSTFRCSTINEFGGDGGAGDANVFLDEVLNLADGSVKYSDLIAKFSFTNHNAYTLGRIKYKLENTTGTFDGYAFIKATINTERRIDWMVFHTVLGSINLMYGSNQFNTVDDPVVITASTNQMTPLRFDQLINALNVPISTNTFDEGESPVLNSVYELGSHYFKGRKPTTNESFDMYWKNGNDKYICRMKCINFDGQNYNCKVNEIFTYAKQDVALDWDNVVDISTGEETYTITPLDGKVYKITATNSSFDLEINPTAKNYAIVVKRHVYGYTTMRINGFIQHYNGTNISHHSDEGFGGYKSGDWISFYSPQYNASIVVKNGFVFCVDANAIEGEL